MVDPGRVEAQSFDVRRAPDPHQHLIDHQWFDAVPGQVYDLVVTLALDPLDLTGETEPDTVTYEGRLDDGGGVWILPSENVIHDLEQRDLTPQATKRLRQFGSDRPAADDRQPARPRRQIEDRFVGEDAGLGQPGDR